MKLTKERKILMGVLGAGLMVLGFDRVVLGTGSSGPRSAEANDETAATPAAPAPPVAAVAAPTRRSDPTFANIAPLSERLDQLSFSGNERDLFAITERWIEAPVEIDNSLVGRAAARRFVDTHRLQAIALRTGGEAATVDGRVVRVGETLDGFTLEAVAPGRATFIGPNNTRARLVMQGH